MYLDYEVKIPDSRHGITRKTIRGITYIYYAYDRKYSVGEVCPFLWMIRLNSRKLFQVFAVLSISICP